jgi:hypothetical protein
MRRYEYKTFKFEWLDISDLNKEAENGWKISIPVAPYNYTEKTQCVMLERELPTRLEDVVEDIRNEN